MVEIGTLSNLLFIREYRIARGMPEESYSPRALSRVFGRPSDKTLAKWLKACDERGSPPRTVRQSNWQGSSLRDAAPSSGAASNSPPAAPTSRPNTPSLYQT